MKPIGRILFPTDFSTCSERAYTHARALAAEFAAELHVLNVLPPNRPEFDDPMEFLELEKESIDTWSDASHAATENGPTIIHARVRVSTPTEGILYYADTHRIDLIVMSTHGRRGLDHFLIGSVAEEVVRLATCPVYTVRDKDRTNLPEGLRRVLVPVDFSDASKPALALAQEMASRRGSSLDLLHVIEEAVFPTTYGVDSVAIAVPRILERTRATLEKFVEASAGPSVPYECHVAIGHVARGIVDFAEAQRTDLIVIATHGLGGIERLLIGSVTEKVIRTSPCPVLAVKSHPRAVAIATPAPDRERIPAH